MEEKLFMRKKDGKVFKLLYIKDFLLNNEIKETGSRFGFLFGVYIMQADDGEVEAEMYPLVYDKYTELAEKK